MWASASDDVLIDGLRDRIPEAVDAFIRRFEAAATRYARAAGVDATDRAHWVAELLYEVAMSLGRRSGAPPHHLGAYVAGACRLRIREERAHEATYRTRLADALSEVHNENSAFREVVVASLSSEHSLRQARGPDWEAAPLAPVLERLVSAFDEGITFGERQLLKWLGDQISYTTIAAWLGVTRPAAVSRIQRLRRRLIEAALRFGTGLERGERAELARFLRRSGTVAEERVRVLQGVPPRGAIDRRDGEALESHEPLRNGTISEDRER
jgi:hypothetical protein